MNKKMRNNTFVECKECNVFTKNIRRHKERNRCKAVRERRMK